MKTLSYPIEFSFNTGDQVEKSIINLKRAGKNLKPLTSTQYVKIKFESTIIEALHGIVPDTCRIVVSYDIINANLDHADIVFEKESKKPRYNSFSNHPGLPHYNSIEYRQYLKDDEFCCTPCDSCVSILTTMVQSFSFDPMFY